MITPCQVMRLMLAWSVRLQHQLTLATIEQLYRDIDERAAS